MSRQFTRDYVIERALGNVAGRTAVNIRGHDDTVPSGGPFGLSPTFGGGSYQFDQSAIDRNATPAVVEVASTSSNADGDPAGTGALTVQVQGLDASGNAQTNNVTMNGTTEVATANTFSAVFALVVLTTGNNNSNVGTIHCGTGTFTTGVPAVRMLSMEIGHNRSASGYYVVPLAKTVVLRRFIATVATGNKDVEISIETSANGTLWFVQAEFGLEAGDFSTAIDALPQLASNTHIRMRATGAATSTVTAFLAGELIDD